MTSTENSSGPTSSDIKVAIPGPCPFCGSKRIEESTMGSPAYGDKLYVCKACGMFMDGHDWDESVPKNPGW
jgi:hypothetical protein